MTDRTGIAGTAAAETDPSTSVSGRPLRADARRNRARVLRAARDLFAADGLSVPLDEIARHAGVGAGTVHRHFPTKEALFAAVVVDQVEQLVADATTYATNADSREALLAMLARMLAEGIESRPLKAALAGTDFDIRTAAPDVAARLRETLHALLQRAQRDRAVRGDIDVDDLFALLAGAFATLRHADAEGAPDRFARLNAVLFDGLRAPR
ncbi:DNA-binding transcriptional regulator, AcrR family [Parafrankia irregularis]|uniref:DNA-binding transcriptional regulator, AcrR family n=1 Tax=Parafrankia irregularis TaxID=795642 RepID=A0A0S4QR67_9ACTN|nr:MULTISPECIES: TetR/AcrR family transcriptional regulator [Parafrankia]MBE3201644.1 helix-turn-helix transcriptional regulator [Parafrankia sp. CH37]CUU57384.1 DNA-binding transcriptional regulator, AcrR family [Parafrankia irregularis]